MNVNYNSFENKGTENKSDSMPNTNTESGLVDIDVNSHRFPHCIVWTPIPILTYVFPILIILFIIQFIINIQLLLCNYSHICIVYL